MKRLVPYIAGAVIALLLWFVARPLPELPEEVALGTIVIPAKVFQDQLVDLSTRKGIEKVTRKEVKPTTRAVAKGAAASVADKFVAAAGRPTTVTDSARESAAGTGNVVTSARPDTASVCLGAGGSVRTQRGLFTHSVQVKLLGVCNPGGDGTIDRWSHVRSPDWSYKSGTPQMSAARGPDIPQHMQNAGFFALGVAAVTKDPRWAGVSGALLILQSFF